uniref:Uncharacterized protein n=1 Tax=Nelumbo nucifera TaxID=4432 RepID=A0A822ZSL9_NELNU|nr:TPA_asm: hypothetical protein HUJ06_004156 [Nelumbo nucifera]
MRSSNYEAAFQHLVYAHMHLGPGGLLIQYALTMYPVLGFFSAHVSTQLSQGPGNDSVHPTSSWGLMASPETITRRRRKQMVENLAISKCEIILQIL